MADRYDPAAVDVAQLLAELGVDARHRGGSVWEARCPLPGHDDDKPSWTIVDDPDDPKHGCHHCFGCSRGGTAIDLVVARYEFSARSSAIAWIVERATGPLRHAATVRIVVGSARRPLFVLPGGVRFARYADWPAPARDYALSRGIEEWQMARWGVGYAVDGRLAGRLVFPARDATSSITSYTARSFTRAPKRYIEPRREEGADPAAIFGEHLWPPTGSRRAVVVTEGAINGLAAERVSRLPIAALYGSQVHLEQVLKVSSFTRAYVLTDPDLAGDRAAEKLEGALARHVEVARVILPRKTDAQSVGPVALLEAFRDARKKLDAV